jgi:protein phosphatase
MGGHQDGERAAELALATCQYFVSASRDRFDASWPFGFDVNLSMDENRLMTAIQLANQQVLRDGQNLNGKSREQGMGTTVVGMLIDANIATIGHVGDSRAYLMRAGELQQLTEDDSWVEGMRRAGVLTAEEARRHSMKNVLTQAIGMKERVEVHLRRLELHPRDLLLFSSDGLHGVVEEAAIRSILFSRQTLESKAKQLIRASLDNGAPDNTSVVLVEYA